MHTLFTDIAEQELTKDLYIKPLNYIYKPYATISDCSLTFFSIIFLPIYNLCLTLLILIETAILISLSFYYYLKNDEVKYEQSTNTCKKSAKIDFQISLATIFVSLSMLVIFLIRLVNTIASFFYMLSDLEKTQLTQISQIKMEIEAISEYNQLGDKINEDLQLIKKTIKDFNSEFNDHIKINKNWAQEYNTLKNQLKIYSTFQQSEEIIILQRESTRNDEISNILRELIGNYPNFTFSESPTIKEINAAYEELEEHHQKVVDLAVIFFPGLQELLNLFKQTNNLDLTLNYRCNNV